MRHRRNRASRTTVVFQDVATEMIDQTLGNPSVAELANWVSDARQRTLDLLADLSDAQLMGAKLDIVNPLLWEIGHIAWFQEKWVLRHVLGRPSIRSDSDALWDSMAIAHDTRWDLPLPTRQETIDYMGRVNNAILETLERRTILAGAVWEWTRCGRK